MKKVVLGLSVVVMSLSLNPAFSATPIKAGSVCAKQGITKTYQGKKYTCIKLGKKLVWNKSAVIKTAAPVPTPTPSPTPTPTPTPFILSSLPANFGDTKPPEFVSGVQNPQEINLSQNSGQIRLVVVLRDDLNSIQPFFFGLRRVDLQTTFVGNVIFRTSVSKLISQVSDNGGITETFELLLDLPKGLAPGTYWLEGGIRDYANNWSTSENNPGKVSFFPLLVIK